MIFTLLDLTLRGTIIFLIVWLVNTLVAQHMQAHWRRTWWLLISIVFLVLLKAPVLPLSPHYENFVSTNVATLLPFSAVVDNSSKTPTAGWETKDVVAFVWFSGMLISLLLVVIQTVNVSRRWTGERFSTDARLLEIVEDCKKLAHVNAPVGLIVSDTIETPAIVGWLRPRILLPLSLSRSQDESRIRHVILHELAHFRFLDVPIGWLFAATCCVHWFNPLSHFASRKWATFREEAADENAIRWNVGEAPSVYGETLLSLIRVEPAPSMPDVIAIGETFTNLKYRIHMITQYTKRTPKLILAATLTAVLAAIAVIQAQPVDGSKDSTEGSQKAVKEAVPNMEQWLKIIDEGKYSKSWDEAAKTFQDALSSEKWVAALTSTREPLGALISRKLASATNPTEVPSPGGKILKGNYVIAQFHTSFANLSSAVETVTFELQNGVWKASGYFIRPR